jgi:hypothetical protein
VVGYVKRAMNLCQLVVGYVKLAMNLCQLVVCYVKLAMNLDNVGIVRKTVAGKCSMFFFWKVLMAPPEVQ